MSPKFMLEPALDTSPMMRPSCGRERSPMDSLSGVYFKFGARVVGHRLRRDMAPVTPEAMTYKIISAPNVK